MKMTASGGVAAMVALVASATAAAAETTPEPLEERWRRELARPAMESAALAPAAQPAPVSAGGGVVAVLPPINVVPPSLGGAAAAPSPPRQADPRVISIMYQEDSVVRVDTKIRYITAVEFASGEEVTAVLAGDSESFEIVRLASGNVISIKPLVQRARTNINVYTDKRAYVLDVREGARRGLIHRVRFDYPKPPPTREELIAAGVIAGPTIARDYNASGDADFRPVEAWDDGTATFFRFATTARRPAVFWSDAAGRDYTTNATQVSGDTVKINIVRDVWTLRLGDETVCVLKGATAPVITARREPREPIPGG